MRKWMLAGLVLGFLMAPRQVHAALVFLQNEQELIPFNYSSQRGVPTSTTVGNPVGSDGRAPTVAQQTADGLPTGLPVAPQFQGHVTFGGVNHFASTNLGSATTFSAIAANIQMPSAPDGSIRLRRVAIGAPYFGQPIAFLFGGVITPPAIDENQNPLPANVSPESYWLAEPHSTSNPKHLDTGYYWSPHALSVFAIQAGPISIVWKRANAATEVLFTNRYVISGSAVKPPKKIYWTQGPGQVTGKLVSVPTGRVREVIVAYHSNFPQYVAAKYVSPGETPVSNQSLEDKRTLWYEQGVISAFNKEGRVFVEFLGESRGADARQHLGFELVDVIKEPGASDVSIELGRRIDAFSDGRSDNHLTPDPLRGDGIEFAYRHSPQPGSVTYYATRETVNLNDFQVHWLEEGVAGIRWPSEFVRYKLVWPSDPASYSHYLRPLAANDEEAKRTAIPLPSQNAPTIAWQDQFKAPDGVTLGRLTEDSRFYTFLTANHPAHRALIQLHSGPAIAFERVFSWLEQNVRDNNFASTIATNLTGWNASDNKLAFLTDDTLIAPRYLQTSVEVGQRITAPMGEAQAAGDFAYLAGHIRDAKAAPFAPYSITAYVDPFSFGLNAGQTGSIIPVNARPGHNLIEVWWFRPNAPDTALGFQPIYWPAVIGRYTVSWPANPSEIILASNDGSGALFSEQASGHLYIQNDATLPGFNPNEEHALMQGGQVYALRDDLNIMFGPNYSSEPYALLEYTDSDGRPSMRPFHVLREKGAVTFNYTATAGLVLQPPMPLPLMEKPMVANKLPGELPVSLNSELDSARVASAVFDDHSVEIHTEKEHHFSPFQPLAIQDDGDDDLPPTKWFLPTSAPSGQKTLSGFISDFKPVRVDGEEPDENLQPGPYLLYSSSLDRYWTGQIQPTTLLPVLDDSNANVSTADWFILHPDGDGDPSLNGWRIGLEELPNIPVSQRSSFLASFTFQDRKGNVWVYRGPDNDSDDVLLAMQFYYKTQPGFFFPADASGQALDLDQQPPAGTITPYLRTLDFQGAKDPQGNPIPEKDSDGNLKYAGHPIYGANIDPANGDGNPLVINYEPQWPANVPILHMAETLTLPKRGLPAIRGQTSLEILYQQSEVQSSPAPSVILHDPTRQKEFALDVIDGTDHLNAIPDSVRKSSYQGKTYFPNLPPHLKDRFFLDPDRGANGALVFQGRFVDEVLGDDYLLLNVLGTKDLETLQNLCISDDSRKADWNEAIANLSTTVETFVPNLARPGTFIESPSLAQTWLPGEPSKIINDDSAVDSYALTAIGAGSGYITLVSGNSRAFTPVADPVSLQIIKVVDTLYKGELKIVPSSNPLGEQVTIQQVVDLAGKPEEYEFQWRITAPVDGAPPTVYETERRLLLDEGAWNHVRYPLAADSIGNISDVDPARKVADFSTDVVPFTKLLAVEPENPATGLSPIVPDGPTTTKVVDIALKTESVSHLVLGNKIFVLDTFGGKAPGTVVAGSTVSLLKVEVPSTVDATQITEIDEAPVSGVPQSIAFRQFSIPRTLYREVWLSLRISDFLGAKIYLDGEPLLTVNTGQNDTPLSSPPSTLFPLPKAYRFGPEILNNGTDSTASSTHTIAIEFFSTALPGVAQEFNLRLEALEGVDKAIVIGSPWSELPAAQFTDGVRAILGESADVRALSDNYLIMRYKPKSGAVWSQWTQPQLVEGWIKRVLAGINPFNQRVTDLFNNRANTDVSLLTQAGARWEGDVALNLDTINDFGLIEIYETILRRGRGLSIDAGINYGPANDALLLAGGYLNDLYMMLGNEAWADAANPTIGIGTRDNTYGDVATALFAFKGQTASLLEEELALLRGRDDFLQPGVEISPIYNRLIWNYTRGIDAGEVIYALNYNIQENANQQVDGIINAEDAAKMFPQGHGDAYGHYLTAAKGYYSLLMDENFDWVPRSEAVTVLGKAVQVDYQDERKFAAAAAAVARTGRQIFDLQWRKDYNPDKAAGWSHLSETRANNTRSVSTTRYWGADHWSSRTMQGAYLNWVVGNAIVLPVDNDPAHEGIQKVDRTTVPELAELTTIAESLQTDSDNAEAGLTPLGLPQSAVPFDLTPSQITSADGRTHFEQIYERAKTTLNNAVTAFDDAKDVTRLLRSEQDSLVEFQATVQKQEIAYENALIEIYGTPYPDDIGPGRTYTQGYTGPDLLHYTYVETPEIVFPELWNYTEATKIKIDLSDVPSDWARNLYKDFDFVTKTDDPNYEAYLEYNLGTHGFHDKPASWTGQRASPGSLQQAISEKIMAHRRLKVALYSSAGNKTDLDKSIRLFESQKETLENIRELQKDTLDLQNEMDDMQGTYATLNKDLGTSIAVADMIKDVAIADMPQASIFGTAFGGDTMFGVRAVIAGLYTASKLSLLTTDAGSYRTLQDKLKTKRNNILKKAKEIADDPVRQSLEDSVYSLFKELENIQSALDTINLRIRELDDADRKIRSLTAQGQRIQSERETFRRRAAALVQGYRTRDAAFRIFRNEKLERYKTLFDLAAQYSFMTAQAYDYETGLLNTDEGRSFLNRIVNARALGVVKNGEPQFAGSNTGDPGLSSALAEMKADWNVLKGRLGFNNPDAYGTTVSLRTENFRVLPGDPGAQNWKDVLELARRDNILDDPDVTRYCLQLKRADNLPVPGLILAFSTTITDGQNLFGHPRAGGDHWFSPSSFATKIFAAGVALEGYRGMSDPSANSADVAAAGAETDQDPPPFLDSLALGATPYIYLIPVGLDAMRSPPLGDTSDIRTWDVSDVSIPLPFNIGASDFSTKQLWQSGDSLTETLFNVRKHQAFRPVSSADVFSFDIYGVNGQLGRSQFTNNRLIGRSVWNTQWKIVIPATELLADPIEGLDRFIQTVTDIKLHLVTYSYSGN